MPGSARFADAQPQDSFRSSEGSRTVQSSFSRQATRRLRPVLSSVGSGKWVADDDLEAGRGAHAQGESKWRVLILAFQTLGVVYGDIGTSPLYVFAGIFQDTVPVTTANIEGAASLIIWTITAIVVVKYALIVLRADDNGQGGSFALYAQLRRQGTALPAAGGLAQQSPSGRTEHALKVQPPPRNKDWRQRFIEHKATQRVLLVAVVLGVGLIMGDGVLTPAISVVSAIEGLETGFPSITRGTIVGVSVAIVVILFGIQQFGTSKIGYTFAPIMIVFFLFNSGVGLYNIFKHSPSIFKVLGPNYWFSYFLRNGQASWRSLSGVLLCITGAEALFADLGHFSRGSIQIGLLCVVYPALILTYLGQAAYLTANPENIDNTFYASMPNQGVFWPMLVIATLAAVVASQALISAVFQIVSQAITQSFFPRFRVTHTSTTHTGQIYIAVINYAVMALTIIVVVAFRTSARLGLAYGLAVNLDLLLTSFFLILVMLTVRRVNPAIPVAFFAVFATIEATFLSSSLLKVPRGGWFSLMLAGIYGYLMLLWFWGSSRKRTYFSRTRKQLAALLKVKRATDAEGQPHDTLSLLSKPTAALQRLPGVGLYYSDAVRGVPHPLVQLVEVFPTLPQVVVFMTVRFVPLPEVLPLERYLVEQLGAPGFYHVVARYGYTQRVQQSEETVTAILQHILALLFRTMRQKMSSDDRLRAELAARPLSATTMQLIDAALGDMHGVDAAASEEEHVSTLHPHSVTLGGMHLSIHGLSSRSTRSALRSASVRPSILGVNWQSDLPEQRPASVSAANAPLPEEDAGPAAPQEIVAGPPVDGSPTATVQTLTVSSADRKRTMQAFEQELQAFGEQMSEVFADKRKFMTTLDSLGGSGGGMDALRSLAREIALVAAAAQEGCLAHVVGRTHLKVLPTKNTLQRYGLQTPFDFLSRTVEQDIATTFGIDDAKLLEVGLKYSL